MTAPKQNSNLKKILQGVSGVGPKLTDHIMGVYSSPDEIMKIDAGELSAKVKGVSLRLAREIKSAVEQNRDPQESSPGSGAEEEAGQDQVVEAEFDLVDEIPKPEVINVYNIYSAQSKEPAQPSPASEDEPDIQKDELPAEASDTRSGKQVTRHVPIRSSGLDFKQEEGGFEDLDNINEEELSASKKVNPFATFHKAEVHLNYASKKSEPIKANRKEFMDIQARKIEPPQIEKTPSMLEMHAEDISPKVSHSEPKQAGNKFPLLGLSFILFGVLFIAAGIWFYNNNDTKIVTPTGDQADNTTPISTPISATISEDSTPDVEEQDTTEPVVEPDEEEVITEPVVEPTPIVASEVSVAVLNGSGARGAAGNAADILRAAGFNVSYVGNANNFSYTDTTIYPATDKAREAEAVHLSLTDSDTITISSSVYPGQTTDVVVVIGQ